MSSSISLFNKLYKFCERNNILTLEKKGNVILNIKYGPLGFLLQQNIQVEWLKYFLTHTEAEIFPTVVQSFSKLPRNSSDAFLISEIADQYRVMMPLIFNHLPFGIAITSDQVQTTNEEVPVIESQDIQWGFKFKSLRTLAFFCNPEKVTYWFHYWQRQRYMWWRRFSDVPSQFLLKSETSNSKAQHCVQIQYEYPWGLQNIETIKMFTESQLLQKFCNLSESQNSQSVIPALVVCETNLDEAVFMYLSNSFEEKWLQGKLKTILRLHHKLCPYKVSILIKGTDNDLNDKLLDVSYRLTKQLKQKGITLFPNFSAEFYCTIDSQIERFDEMGIPYIIILTPDSLITGIAGLRNRDTTLEEHVHITELTSKILSYLFMDKDTNS